MIIPRAKTLQFESLSLKKALILGNKRRYTADFITNGDQMIFPYNDDKTKECNSENDKENSGWLKNSKSRKSSSPSK